MNSDDYFVKNLENDDQIKTKFKTLSHVQNIAEDNFNKMIYKIELNGVIWKRAITWYNESNFTEDTNINRKDIRKL